MAFLSSDESRGGIDWNNLWQHQMALADLKWEDERYRHERTQLPPIGLKTSNYADELIDRMALSPRHSVLDIGCGDGALALRIAKRVRHVTALDANPKLLFPVTQRAVLEGVTNLKFLNLDWMEARIGQDIAPHDIVLASRFRQITNLRQFLEQMHTAAAERCYLTWIAERDEMEAGICAILGKAYHPLPEYRIIVNMLHDMGICAGIDIFETAETHRFSNQDDAVAHEIRGYPIENFEVRQRISELVARDLNCDEGNWWKRTRTKWALIWWEK